MVDDVIYPWPYLACHMWLINPSSKILFHTYFYVYNPLACNPFTTAQSTSGPMTTNPVSIINYKCSFFYSSFSMIQPQHSIFDLTQITLNYPFTTIDGLWFTNCIKWSWIRELLATMNNPLSMHDDQWYILYSLWSRLHCFMTKRSTGCKWGRCKKTSLLFYYPRILHLENARTVAHVNTETGNVDFVHFAFNT